MLCASSYREWYRLKHSHGIYFITCEKSNSAAEICSPDMLDRAETKMVRWGGELLALCGKFRFTRERAAA